MIERLNKERRSGGPAHDEQLHALFDILSKNSLRRSKLCVSELSVMMQPRSNFISGAGTCTNCISNISHSSFSSSLSSFSDHAAELGNAVPTKPLIFMKPPSSFIQAGQKIEVNRIVKRQGMKEYVLRVPCRFLGDARRFTTRSSSAS